MYIVNKMIFIALAITISVGNPDVGKFIKHELNEVQNI